MVAIFGDITLIFCSEINLLCENKKNLYISRWYRHQLKVGNKVILTYIAKTPIKCIIPAETNMPLY